MKLKEVRNFEDLMLEFEVKIGRRTLGCPFGDVQLSGGVLKLFFPFNPSLNFAKFHLNSRVPPP